MTTRAPHTQPTSELTAAAGSLPSRRAVLAGAAVTVLGMGGAATAGYQRGIADAVTQTAAWLTPDDATYLVNAQAFLRAVAEPLAFASRAGLPATLAAASAATAGIVAERLVGVDQFLRGAGLEDLRAMGVLPRGQHAPYALSGERHGLYAPPSGLAVAAFDAGRAAVAPAYAAQWGLATLRAGGNALSYLADWSAGYTHPLRSTSPQVRAMVAANRNELPAKISAVFSAIGEQAPKLAYTPVVPVRPSVVAPYGSVPGARGATDRLPPVAVR